VLINFVGGRDMSLQEVNQAAELVSNRVDEEAEIIFGATVDEDKKDRVRVMILATGFSAEAADRAFQHAANGGAKNGGGRVKLISEGSAVRPGAATTPRIETPPPAGSASQQEEDLDVPAFLRRIKK
jgi:cell division protein FtsZ